MRPAFKHGFVRGASIAGAATELPRQAPAAGSLARARRGSARLRRQPRTRLPAARRQALLRQALERLPVGKQDARRCAEPHPDRPRRCRRELAETWVHMCPAQVYEVSRRGEPGRERRRCRGDGLELHPVRRDLGEGGTPDAARGRGRSRIQPDVTPLAAVIRGRLHRDAALLVGDARRTFGGRAFLKAELFQKTGSFKPRGVLTKLGVALARGEAARASSPSRPATTPRRSRTAARARGSTASSSCGGRERAQGRGDAGLRRDRRPGGGRPAEAFERVEALRRETRAHARPSLRRPVRRRRPGDGRASRSARTLPEADVVVVPGRRRRARRGIADGAPGASGSSPSSPKARPRCTMALEAGQPVPVAPKSIADALNAPCAGAPPARDLLGARSRVGARHRRGDRGGFRFLYERAKLAAEPGARGRCGGSARRQGGGRRRADRGGCCLRRQRSRPK